MPARVRLTIVAGDHVGRQFVFSSPTIGAIGRSRDCLVQLPNHLTDLHVSRRHCLVAIDPPVVRVRDLGSRNGTFLNGVIIGRRTAAQKSRHLAGRVFPYVPAHDGDEIRIGDTVLRVTASVWGEDRKSLPDATAIQALERPPALGAAHGAQSGPLARCKVGWPHGLRAKT
jgi:predicted component of type VI protein secretion system